MGKIRFSCLVFCLFLGSVMAAPKPSLKLNYRSSHFKSWIRHFSSWKDFQRHRREGEKYRFLVNKIFLRYRIPTDLYYVGLIESGFNSHIRSKAKAVGHWQFIAGTARRYGLRVDRYVDERRNIHKATEAAAHYLKDLYNVFASWELALCAYNSGENRVLRAIMRGNTRNYWKLARKKLLPLETSLYISKISAARYLDYKWKRAPISRSRKLYTNAETLILKKTFNVRKIARQLGIKYRTLKLLNPDIKRKYVKVRRNRPFRLIVPRGTQIYTSKISKRKNHKKSKRTYIVKKGDNLSHIATRFNTSVRALFVLNSLESHTIYPNQRLILPSKG